MTRQVIQLPNGARIALDPMNGIRTASVGVWIAAGARDELPGQNGLAHFLEHMAFKGAGGRNALEIAEYVEGRGAVMNASTDYERTSYYIRCLAEDAPNMLEVALSLVLDCAHPKAEIAREKGVVLQEIGEAADQADDLVQDLAQAAAFPDHALGRPVLGSEETLKGISRTDLFRFAADNYTPRRIVVSLAGAFDADAVTEEARRWLEPLNDRTAAATPTPVPGAGLRTVTRDLEQSHLLLSAPTCSALDDRRFAVRILAEILGGGMASRLFQEVREKRGLAYTIDAYCDQYRDAGRMNVAAGCAPRDVAEVTRIVREIWSQLASLGPTEVELARAKSVAIAQFAMAAETPAARASSAAYELLGFDRLIEIEETLGRISAVTCEDVRKAAADSFDGSRVAACVGPAEGNKGADAFL